jgi:hypothetical protein
MEMCMTMRLRMKCRTCGGFEDEHVRDCPREALKKLYDSELKWKCSSAACDGTVAVTNEDFLQCRRCRRKFSRGTIADTENPERTLLHRISPDEDYEQVLVFATRAKGGTVFKVDVAAKQLRERAVAWRRTRRGKGR